MTQLNIPYTFQNQTTSDANQVDQNFNSIATVVNGKLADDNMAPNSLTSASIANEGIAAADTQNIMYAQDLFSSSMILSGGVVTKDGTNANQADVTSPVIGWVQQSDGSFRRLSVVVTNYKTTIANATYYLDLNADGSVSWGQSHSNTQHYATIATVTSDASSNVNVITDTRNLVHTVLADFIRKDAGAPSPQTVANLVTFNGGLGGKVSVVNSSQTITSDYFGGFVEFNGSTASTLTLPDPAVNSAGKFMTFMRVGSGTLTLSTPRGAFYGPGGNSASTITIPSGQFMTLVSDGSNWIVQYGSTRNIFDDGSGNAIFAGSISAQNISGISGTWTPTSGTLNVASGTYINIASAPPSAMMFYVEWNGGYNPLSGTAGSPVPVMWGAQTSSATMYSNNVPGSYGATISNSGNNFEVCDGTYMAYGYFCIHNGYFCYAVTSTTTSTNTGNIFNWAVK